MHVHVILFNVMTIQTHKHSHKTGVTKTRKGKRNGKRNGMKNGMKRKICNAIYAYLS